MDREYTVKLTFIYSDTVKIEASNKDEAIHKASFIAEETYDYAYDSEILSVEAMTNE